MSAEAVSNTNRTTIYVRLLGEGTEVFRPSLAEVVGEGVFRLIEPEAYDPEDEEWEFAPGSVVKAVVRRGTLGSFLVASSLAE